MSTVKIYVHCSTWLASDGNGDYIGEKPPVTLRFKYFTRISSLQFFNVYINVVILRRWFLHVFLTHLFCVEKLSLTRKLLFMDVPLILCNMLSTSMWYQHSLWFQGTTISQLERDIGSDQFPPNEHYFGLVNVSVIMCWMKCQTL